MTLKRAIKSSIFIFLSIVSVASAEITGLYTFPGGSTGTVQYNSDGLFDGTTDFTYSSNTKTLNVTSMTATLDVRARSYYGDGSNLTGIVSAGGGGASSLAIATGSAQASNIISSPTSIVNFSSGAFKVRFISPSTAYIDIDYSSITAQGRVSASGGGSDNLGSHIATTTLQARFGINASSGVFTSSLTAFGVISSTSGFVGGGSTFSRVAVGPSGSSFPSITFGNDDNTGIYSQVADNVGISVGGTGGFVFNSNGLTINPGNIFVPSGSESIPGYAFLTEQDSGLFLNGSSDVGISVGGTDRLVSRAAGYNESVSSFTSKLVVTSSNGFIGGNSTFTNLNISNSINSLLVNASTFAVGASSFTESFSPKLRISVLNPVISLSSNTADVLLEGTYTGNFTQGESPTLRFMAHGDPTANPVDQSTATWFDHKIRSVASTYSKNHATYVFSDQHGRPIWATNNYKFFQFYPPGDPIGNMPGYGEGVGDVHIGNLAIANYTSTATAKAQDLENRISTGTLVYAGGIHLTAIAQGANVLLSQSGSTLTIAATSGGGGGGGGVAVQSGGSVVSVSTFLFPGGTITSDGLGASSVTFTPQILSTYTALAATAAYTSKQFTSAFSSISAVGISTQNIQTFFAGFTSTSDARGNTFVNFRSTTDSALQNIYTSVNSTWNFTNTFMSTSDARGNTFVNFRSTTDTSLQAIYTSVNSTWNFTNVFMSTSDSRGNTFVNFRSTSDNLFNTINSTMMAVRKDTATLAMEVSTRTLVYNGGINITAFAQGANVTLSQSGSTLTIAGAAGGGGGGGGGFTFDGSAHAAFSTVSIRTPFGTASVAASANNVSSFTILGTTAPYATISIPASAWVGVKSSATPLNGGFVNISSGASPYNIMGLPFHEFNAPTSTPSFATTIFSMPYDWDGSSIAFEVRSFKSTGTTTILGWSLGGVALSSGTNLWTANTSSATVWTSYNSSWTIVDTDMSPAYNIEGSPRPGSLVKFWISAFGGRFDGLPKMVDVVIAYRKAIWDGRVR